MLDIVFVVAGLVLLFAGGEALVRGAIALARRFGVSELVIGLTIVGFGTSMPELLVSAEAALKGQPDIAIGNVVGSNIANILLIAGVAAAISPMSGWQRSIRGDVVVVLAATALMVAFAASGSIPAWGGLAMLGLLGAYLFKHYDDGRRSLASAPQPRSAAGRWQSWLDWLTVIAGLMLLFVGANLLVDGATAIARRIGVSEAVIGLTIVALGTSLPELATTLVAAWRGRGTVALGNVIGSNIFNLLGILGATALIAPLPIAGRFMWSDVPLMAAVTMVFSALIVAGGRIGRPAGAAMLAAYCLYIAYLFVMPA